jgi:deoxyribose-phosphate aldolase
MKPARPENGRASIRDPESLAPEALAGLIDHTNLKAFTPPSKIDSLCAEAAEYGFTSVCVNPVHVGRAARALLGTGVDVCTVVGFPLGANRSDAKAFETATAVREGAAEIDMVLAVGALRAGDEDLVARDVRAVIGAADGRLVKVILETCYLTDDEIVKACLLCREAGADFVKTSTGFGAFGAFESHVRLMRSTVGEGVGVKASGGISDFREALRMLEAGANRLGVSAGIPIIEGFRVLRFGRGWLADEIPCHLCPSRSATLSKLPKELYLYYKTACLECPHRTFNLFYD